jgi:hypothetical protein
MLWVTRAGGNVDRVACPWLIILTPDDHQKLEWELPMYDALYAFCRRKATV